MSWTTKRTRLAGSLVALGAILVATLIVVFAGGGSADPPARSAKTQSAAAAPPAGEPDGNGSSSVAGESAPRAGEPEQPAAPRDEPAAPPEQPQATPAPAEPEQTKPKPDASPRAQTEQPQAPAGQEVAVPPRAHWSGTGSGAIGTVAVRQLATLRWSYAGRRLVLVYGKKKRHVLLSGKTGTLIIPAAIYDNLRVRTTDRWTLSIAPN
jgi:hypothetical protein